MDKITRISTCLQCILLLVMLPVWVSAQSTPVTVGYRSADYGTTVNSTPAGENPERKLWWNDGSWWGCLWSDSAASYRIYRFDIPTQNWLDTGTDLDDRDGSKADVLWDGQKLYVASHIFTNSPSAAVGCRISCAINLPRTGCEARFSSTKRRQKAIHLPSASRPSCPSCKVTGGSCSNNCRCAASSTSR